MISWIEPVGSIHEIRKPQSIVLISYPDDLGIELNGGRLGARLGPQAILKWLSKLVLPAEWNSDKTSCYSLTLERPREVSLSDWQHQLSGVLEDLCKQDLFLIHLGGGHDYGFPAAWSFAKSAQASRYQTTESGFESDIDACSTDCKPIVVNFDAHLDVRQVPDSGPNSGTPFRQLIEASQNASIPLGYKVLFAQPHCNSSFDLDWAKSQRAEMLLKPYDLGHDEMFKSAQSILNALPSRSPLFLSVCIDVFSSAFAPGCSQSWPTGISPRLYFQLFKELTQKHNLKSLGIFEMSPPFDVDNCTAKLAALIAYSAIEHHLVRQCSKGVGV